MRERSGIRLCCCVPHCGRTIAAPRGQWICARHWRITDRVWRRRFYLFRRRGRPDLAHRMFERLKAQAIERAAGITG